MVCSLIVLSFHRLVVLNKHILFVLDYYLPHKGGSETVFEAIISRLQEKGYEISVLASRHDISLPTYEEKDHLHIYRTGKGRIRFMFAALFKGMRILRNHSEISLIHTSTYGGAIPASLLGMFFRKRVVLTVHEIFGKLRMKYKGRFFGTIYRIFERMIFLCPYDVYHCVSYYTMNSIRMVYRVPEHKIAMIYNGVDASFWDPHQVSSAEIKSRRESHHRENRFVLMYYGHAGKSKGLDVLVAALSELITIDPRLLVVINLIASKRTAYIEEKIKKLHLGSSVQLYRGREKNDLRIAVASCDMVIAPSLSEGFGSVHTEAVAMGKPLLTTYIASLPEVVWGNVRFIPPASKREIIQAIIERDHRIGNPDYIIPRKDFSRSTTVRELIKLYR